MVLGAGWASSSVMATKLKPLKSWCALALGGTPGESDTRRNSYWCSTTFQSVTSVIMMEEEFSCRYLWVFSWWTLDQSRRYHLAVLLLAWTEGESPSGRDSIGPTERSMWPVDKTIVNQNDAFVLKETLAFQSIVLKNWCLLISSTPSGPAPTRGNILSCQLCTRHSRKS